jgi:hypothetical protein
LESCSDLCIIIIKCKKKNKTKNKKKKNQKKPNKQKTLVKFNRIGRGGSRSPTAGGHTCESRRDEWGRVWEGASPSNRRGWGRGGRTSEKLQENGGLWSIFSVCFKQFSCGQKFGKNFNKSLFDYMYII